MASPGATDPVLNELQSKDQTQLLDAIDKLRLHGIDRTLDLPQLIVCGDQSAGKSSVLEAIARVKFPVGDGLTTRFATEVILRRSSQPKIKVKIVPADGRTEAQRRVLLEDFDPELLELTEPEDFASLVAAASSRLQAMDPDDNFWYDKLRVEICGPDQPPLSLVDLPGLIQSQRGGEDRGDKKKVRELVEEYMRNPRSIILAVVPAHYDVENQQVVALVKEVETSAERTLGVITKPDRLTAGKEEEKQCVRLARNEEVRFGLGWHVLMNKTENLSDFAAPDDRDEAEKNFFEGRIWRTQPGNDLGIKSLRTKLSKVLMDCIREDLPDLVSEMDKMLQACKATHKKQGTARDSPSEQQQYLRQILSAFQSLVKAGVNGNFDDDDFSDFFSGPDETRLRAMIVDRRGKFAQTMREKGHRHVVYGVAGERDSKLKEASTWIIPTFRSDSDNESGDLMPLNISRALYCSAIAKFMGKNRGRGLPDDVPPNVVGPVFRFQSAAWERIGREHIQRCWSSTLQFLQLALHHVSGEYTADKILEHFIHPEFNKRVDVLEKKLTELLGPYRRSHPITSHRSYLEIQSRAARESSLGSNDQNAFSGDGDPELVAALKAYEQMNTYYKIALETFVDNVSTLAVEACLLDDLPSLLPAGAFETLDPATLSSIAAEPEWVRETRNKTAAQAAALEDVVRTCRLHAGNQGRRRITVPQTMTSTERRPVNGTGNTTSANLFSFHGTPAASSPAPSQLFGSGGMALGNTSSALASGVPAFGGGTVSSGTNPSVGLFGRSGGFGSESRQKAKESNGTGTPTRWIQ